MTGMNKTFKHSGAFGDLLYSLPIVKHFGGGGFYLHLSQLDWVGQHYYGSAPAPFHQGRMTFADFEYMQSFMTAQTYINKFDVLQKDTEITHNLDRFRVPFVGHPGNYVDIYSSVFGLDPSAADRARTTPWLAVPAVEKVRDIVVSRTARWIPAQPGVQWSQWKEQGFEERAVFVGLPDEHTAFCNTVGWNIPFRSTATMLEVAQIIAGAELFIGNQSSNLALAIGLGKPYYCEERKELPRERSECYFPDQPGGHYF